MEGQKVKTKLKSKILAIITALAMAVTMLPAMAFAGTVTAQEQTYPANPRISNGITTWDCIYFGEYPQGYAGNDGYYIEPIKWRVLNVNGNDALLLSAKNLDAMYYNEYGRIVL